MLRLCVGLMLSLITSMASVCMRCLRALKALDATDIASFNNALTPIRARRSMRPASIMLLTVVQRAGLLPATAHGLAVLPRGRQVVAAAGGPLPPAHLPSCRNSYARGLLPAFM